jgi:hypothetical protein
MASTYLERERRELLEVEHVVVANSNDEVRLALRHVGVDLERSVVVEQRQREDAVLAGVVVADSRDVRLGKDQRRACRRILLDARHIA